MTHGDRHLSKRSVVIFTNPWAPTRHQARLLWPQSLMVALQGQEVQENEEFPGPQALLESWMSTCLAHWCLNIQEWPCLKRSLSRTPCDNLPSPRWGRTERKEPHFSKTLSFPPPSYPHLDLLYSLPSSLLPQGIGMVKSTKNSSVFLSLFFFYFILIYNTVLVLFFHVFKEVSVLLLRPLKLTESGPLRLYRWLKINWL